jgi:hypothetical protein
MHSSGFILGIANRYHRYRFAVEWERHKIPGNLLHRQPVTIYRVLVGKSEDKEITRKTTKVDNIKMNLREIGWGFMD